MEITVVVAPPGGGEAEYSLPFEVPEAPNEGDYISVKRAEADGFEHFIVRRRRWVMEFPETPPIETRDDYTVGETKRLYIEAEIAEGPAQSEEHERGLSRHEDAKKHEKSAYHLLTQRRSQPLRTMFDESGFPREYECDGCGVTETVQYEDVQDVPSYITTSPTTDAVDYVMARHRGWSLELGQGTRCPDCIDGKH